MDELVERIVAETGVDPEVARNAAIIILKFLAAEGPPDKVGPLIDSLPGARAAMEASLLGGSSGLMGVFGDLTGAGLGMGDIQGTTRAVVGFAREKAGAEAVDAAIAAIPGVSQFV